MVLCADGVVPVAATKQLGNVDVVSQALFLDPHTQLPESHLLCAVDNGGPHAGFNPHIQTPLVQVFALSAQGGFRPHLQTPPVQRSESPEHSTLLQGSTIEYSRFTFM